MSCLLLLTYRASVSVCDAQLSVAKSSKSWVIVFGVNERKVKFLLSIWRIKGTGGLVKS